MKESRHEMNDVQYEDWEIHNGGPCPCEGEAVQVQSHKENRLEAKGGVSFIAIDGPIWYKGQVVCYRRVKKPEMITITGYVEVNAGGWLFGSILTCRDTHELTFEIINSRLCNPVIKPLANVALAA